MLTQLKEWKASKKIVHVIYPNGLSINGYIIGADDSGITIVDKDGYTHCISKESWKDVTDKDA